MKTVNVGDFQKKKYLANLKLLSTFNHEKSSAYIYLVATFISLSLLVLFAIGPTLGTITELHKKHEDAMAADAALATKIQNMNTLRAQYSQISADIPLIFSAMPEQPSVTDFFGRIQGAAANNNVRILTLGSSKIPITSLGVETEAGADPSFGFSVTVAGSYTNALRFFGSLSNFDRVITVSSFSVARAEEGESGSQERILTIEGKAYYLK